MSFFDTFAWYYSYATIYTFLFGFLNHSYVLSFFPGYSYHSINHKTDVPFNFNNLLWNFLWVTIWCTHHSTFLRPAVKDKVKQYLPKTIDVDSLFLTISASIMNIMTYYWLVSEYYVGGGIIYNFSNNTFLSQNIIYILCMLYYSYCEYYAITSGIYEESDIVLKGPYGIIRHPMQLSFLMIFWLTPYMTMQRFLLSLMLTIYIFIGVWFEERTLIKRFGKQYINYKKIVPAFIPYRLIYKSELDTKFNNAFHLFWFTFFVG